MNACNVSRLFIPLPSIDKSRRVPLKTSEAGCFLSIGHLEKPQRDGGLGEGNMNACNVSRLFIPLPPIDKPRRVPRKTSTGWGFGGRGMNACNVSRLFIPLPPIDKPRRVPLKTSEAGCFLSIGHLEKPQRDGGLGEGNMNACNVSRLFIPLPPIDKPRRVPLKTSETGF